MSDRSDCRNGYNPSPPFSAQGDCVTLQYMESVFVSYRVDCARDQTFSLYWGKSCKHAPAAKETLYYRVDTPKCVDDFFPGVRMGVCCTADPPYFLEKPAAAEAANKNATSSSSLLDADQQAWLKSVFAPALAAAEKTTKKKTTITAFPASYCFSEVCGPQTGTTRPSCLRKIGQQCKQMKWIVNKCAGKQQTKGCYCHGYCQYSCSAACKTDAQCEWSTKRKLCEPKPHYSPEAAGWKMDKYCNLVA